MNRIKVLVLLIVLVFPAMLFAQFTESKQISRRFKVNAESRIEIINKYGRIKLNSWEKDSVVFDIKIKVEDKKLSRLEKQINEIDFDFISSPHFLIVRTKVGDNRSSLEKEIINLKETVLQSDGKTEIDITVWMPKTNPLKLENKFGDIYIDDYTGDIDITISNGNLKAHDFAGKTNIKLSFGDATVNQMNSGRLDCNYSDIYIKKADKLQIFSKSSTLEITSVNEISTDSRRDKYRIQNIENLIAKGSFTNFRINELSELLNLKSEYGNIEIEKIAPAFKSLFFESKSTDIFLNFSDKAEFAFEITHTKSQTSFSRKMEIKKEEVIDEKEKRIKMNGNFGSGTRPLKLTIVAYGGRINITDY